MFIVLCIWQDILWKLKKNTVKTQISSISVSGQRSHLGPSGVEQEEGERGEIFYSLLTSTLRCSLSRLMIDEQCSLSIELLFPAKVNILTHVWWVSDQVTKLRKDLEECRIQHDATLVSLKKKQADSIAEVRSNMDSFVFWTNTMISPDVRANGSAEQDEGQVSWGYNLLQFFSWWPRITFFSLCLGVW